MNELCTRCDYVALCFQENTNEVDGVKYVISIKGRPILFACCKGVRIALRYALQEITNEVDALDYFSMKSSKSAFDFVFYVIAVCTLLCVTFFKKI
jgi:hypothetical protein